MIKRKDSRGRVLNDGEIQRSDGRYCYQYTDAFGKRKSVYSWRLTKTLQYIMGHSDIGVTLNTYTHTNFDNAQEEM